MVVVVVVVGGTGGVHDFGRVDGTAAKTAEFDKTISHVFLFGIIRLGGSMILGGSMGRLLKERSFQSGKADYGWGLGGASGVGDKGSGSISGQGAHKTSDHDLYLGAMVMGTRLGGQDTASRSLLINNERGIRGGLVGRGRRH